MVALDRLVERAHAIRQEAQLVRGETRRLSHESAAAARQLAEQRRSVEEVLMRTQAMRRTLPTWPAWGGPDPDELKLTLVPLE